MKYITQPDELTPVEKHRGLYLKREDLYKPFGKNSVNGGKLRQCYKLVESIKDNYDGVISCCSIYSPQAPITAAVAKYFSLKSVICYGGTKDIRLNNLDMPLIAKQFGADTRIISKSGIHKILYNKAKKIALKENLFVVDYGFNIIKYPEIMYSAISEQVKNIPDELDNLVITCGSGITTIGVLLGLEKYHKKVKRVYLVATAPSRDRLIKNTLFLYGIFPEYKIIDLFHMKGFKYEEEIFEEIDGIKLHPNYEAKAFNWLKNNIDYKKEKTLLWIVGSKPIFEEDIMKKEIDENYSSPVMITQQFKFCPNPFRVDLYKGCDFGCKYCFANSGSQKGKAGWAQANFRVVEKLFKKAFDSSEDTKDVTIELLRRKVPLHCGGMSDPFQKREFEYKLTYKLIELSNKYNYPICFSTKQCDLPEEYFKILDPKLHAFQVSIMGWDDDFIRKYEVNTPTAKERLDFVKKLRDKGFWCSIRIQPLVDIDQAIKLVEMSGTYPSYITVEHLKIPNDDIAVKKLFINEYNSSRFYKSPLNMRNIEVQPDIKQDNIRRIKELANKNGVLIGVGDNDLHHLSQSRCCCGIDTIEGGQFDNYLKYNLTYFVTGDCNPEELYCMKCKGSGCFYDHQFDFKEETNKYCYKNDGLILKSEHPEVLMKLFGVSKRRLF